MFPSSNAVNGLLFDFAHTLGEKSPWLRIDLEAQHVIHEVEVFARSDCCGKYWNIYIKLHSILNDKRDNWVE